MIMLSQHQARENPICYCTLWQKFKKKIQFQPIQDFFKCIKLFDSNSTYLIMIVLLEAILIALFLNVFYLKTFSLNQNIVLQFRKSMELKNRIKIILWTLVLWHVLSSSKCENSASFFALMSGSIQIPPLRKFFQKKMNFVKFYR